MVDVGLEDHSRHNDFIKKVVDLVGVEDEIELANILKALVKRLDENLNEIQDT